MNDVRITFIGIVVALILVGFATSCRYQESFYENNDAILELSRDTVRFDTVFTTIGSATRSFKIKNPFNDRIRLSRVYLEKGDKSFFRINVNGTDGKDVEKTEIPAKDSIYVFAEVTVDPDMPVSDSPYIIEEYVLIEVNGNTQRVLLEAWGQNANYVPNSKGRAGLALLSCNLDKVVWNDPKPYVIYGILLIDSCTLELPPGCRVYVHGGIASRDDIGTYNDGRIICLKDGNIIANGTFANPVTIEGDRLESEYEGVAAQWTGVQIFPESKNNLFRHTIIKDGIVGLSADSASTVTLESCQIFNHASRALVSFHVEELNISNCLFHSASSETVLLKYGGRINIDYSTFGGYSDQNAALYVDNWRCTDPIFCGPILVNPMFLNMRNSIVAGNGTDELALVDGTDKMEEGAFNFTMSNNLIRIDTLINSNNYPNFFDNCINCASININEALFLDQGEGDFHLDTLSQGEMIAKPIPEVLFDLDMNSRDASTPDAGCYEYQY